MTTPDQTIREVGSRSPTVMRIAAGQRHRRERRLTPVPKSRTPLRERMRMPAPTGQSNAGNRRYIMNAKVVENAQGSKPSLDNLAAKINDAHGHVEKAALSCVEHAQEAGHLLLEVKDKLGHGEYEDWIKANCKFSVRTAGVYLRLANELPKLDEANRQRATDLSLRGVLKLLANPKTKVEAAPTCPAAEPEVPVISLADVAVADLLEELETRGQEAAEDGVLRLVRKWADAIGKEVIIQPKALSATAGESEPDADAEADAEADAVATRDPDGEAGA